MNRFSREKSFENIACPCAPGGFRAAMRVQGEAIGAPMRQETSAELAKASRPDVDSLQVRGIEAWMTGWGTCLMMERIGMSSSCDMEVLHRRWTSGKVAGLARMETAVMGVHGVDDDGWGSICQRMLLVSIRGTF